MKKLLEKYACKMQVAGLAANPLILGMDDEIFSNRTDSSCSILNQIMDNMNINSLICASPAEPYKTILDYLVNRYPETITPSDCETRTFLHDLPVTTNSSPEAILERLKKRKSVITVDRDNLQIITHGTVSPEQAFITFSSVCFSSFVLFFASYLADLRSGDIAPEQKATYNRVIQFLAKPPVHPPSLAQGPFTREKQVIDAMIEAGRFTVEYGLVDSYFGNISYRLGETVYISQTGSSLDELAGCIDPCPLDDSSTAGITASSELVAHNEIFLRSENRAILHGHPKFAVILSMDCDVHDCPNKDQCHIKCSQERFIRDIPIVPGEVGTGPTGLCHTLPPSILDRRGSIVWGHGLFTTGKNDFNEPFENLLDIENMCRSEYFNRIQSLS